MHDRIDAVVLRRPVALLAQRKGLASSEPISLASSKADMALIPDKITFKRVTEKESICYR